MRELMLQQQTPITCTFTPITCTYTQAAACGKSAARSTSVPRAQFALQRLMQCLLNPCGPSGCQACLPAHTSGGASLTGPRGAPPPPPGRPAPRSSAPPGSRSSPVSWSTARMLQFTFGGPPPSSRTSVTFTRTCRATPACLTGRFGQSVHSAACLATGQSGRPRASKHFRVSGTHPGADSRIELQRLDFGVVLVLAREGDLVRDLAGVHHAMPPPALQLNEDAERADRLRGAGSVSAWTRSRDKAWRQGRAIGRLTFTTARWMLPTSGGASSAKAPRCAYGGG